MARKMLIFNVWLVVTRSCTQSNKIWPVERVNVVCHLIRIHNSSLYSSFLLHFLVCVFGEQSESAALV